MGVGKIVSMNKFIFFSKDTIYADIFGKKIALDKGAAIMGGVLVLCILIVVGIVFFKSSNADGIVIDNTQPTAAPIETGLPQSTDNAFDVDRNKEIKVYVTGHVKSPGVFNLKAGSIIADAIYLAGGATEDAAIANINMVYVLKENSMITVKSKTEAEANKANVDSATLDFGAGINFVSGSDVIEENANTSEIININSASETDLQKLKGIGPKKAQDIISYREENEPFKKIEDIMNVKGIGQATFENIKANITV